MKDDTCQLRATVTNFCLFFLILSHQPDFVVVSTFDVFIAAGNVANNIYHFEIEWPVAWPVDSGH